MTARNPALRLAGYSDPYRDDSIERLGPDGTPSGSFSRVKMIVSHDRTGNIYEVCDDYNRTLYVVSSGHGKWLEVEL